ncbi:EAL domain-containing protein [Magnetospirillum sp. 64-120]|uniref:putative bifunctional diguanylate cyclase/phosphodiesterase n=1 Tax=Magnetospirillum sp. 64-120 TaxID=1895778 RepID=UPI00092C78EF|nr:EAL domain-containing protein [Magnetospirillum sp. 64-120]OJX70383.1 MAG: hypothetical protein BGO92_17490 [Magnetospirillum sp. 64-120]
MRTALTLALLWSVVTGLSLWWNIDWQHSFAAGLANTSQPAAVLSEYINRHLSVLVLVHVAVWTLGMAGLVYGSHQATQRQGFQARAEKQNRLANHVFNNALEALVVTTGDGTIVRVNPAFSLLTGYEAEEVVGHKANVLRSFHHDDAFYADMWRSLLETGTWQGELKNRRKDGSIFIARESITALWEPGLGKPRYYVASFADITAQVESQQHIEHLAHYDPLTDLPNRVLFRDRLNHAVTHAGRERRRIAVLFLDLDGFKKVNDTIGHRAGDSLLVEVARRLRSCTRSSDTISRLGGDEFALVLERIDDAADVVVVADKLLAALAGSFLLEGREVFVGSSIGISMYPEDGDNAEMLLKHADTAMYQAKAEGKGRFKFYSADMTRRQEHRLELEGALRIAIENRSFEVHYQPKQRLKGGSIAGFEALVRWNHPTLGMISPVEFIPLAEELGLITHIDLLVLEQACAMGVRCQEQGHSVTMAVNLSSLDLKNPDLPTLIAGILDQTGLPPHLLVLEITESFAMEVGKGQTQILERLTQLGVSLAIDDFGTGYSSLSYLKELPVESVKIDRSFVRDIGTDSRDTMLVSTIVGLAHSLNLKVVAEGVEDHDQRALLDAHNCDEAQGYLVARPMPADQVFGFLQGMAASAIAE